MRAQYEDVTEKRIKNRTPNSHKVKEAKYFKDKNGTKYYVDGKYVMLDYTEKEKEVAEWLEKMFGGEIYLLPRINKPEGIKTADYLWNGEYWDLKTIFGMSKYTLGHSIGNKKEQSCNFIFEISNKEIDNDCVIGQIKTIFASKYHTNWVKNIIIKRGDKLIGVYKKR